MSGQRVIVVDEDLAELLADVLPRVAEVLAKAEHPPVVQPAALTIAETAHELRLSVRKVEQMVAAGEIDHVRFGKAIRIPRSEISRAVTPPAADDRLRSAS